MTTLPMQRPPTNQQVAAGGAISILNTITQSLPTGVAASLPAQGASQLPYSPQGALPVYGAQPLAVMNPSAYRPGYYGQPQPFYQNRWLMAGVGLAAIVTIFSVWKLRR